MEVLTSSFCSLDSSEDAPLNHPLTVAQELDGSNPASTSDTDYETRIVELERQIKRCNWLAQEAQSRATANHCYTARDEADRWRQLRDVAIEQLGAIK